MLTKTKICVVQLITLNEMIEYSNGWGVEEGKVYEWYTANDYDTWYKDIK